MTIRELIYVDQRRLNTYYEQIASPVIYDKVPTWKAELSLTGVGAEAQQERHGRAPSTTEKISAVMEHLRKHQQLSAGRISWRVDGTEKPFRFEAFEATKLAIPPVSIAALVPSASEL